MMISAIATPVLRVAYTKDKSAFYLIVPLNSCLERIHGRTARHWVVKVKNRKHPAMQRVTEAFG